MQQAATPLARTLQTPVRVVMRKKVYGIRHGQAWHNVLYPKLGEKAYRDYQDTSLTSLGMVQAIQQRGLHVDLVFVSPLMRTLQTAQYMFPHTPTIALECLKEHPQAEELCNKRSSKSELKLLFSKVDFRNLQTESDEIFGRHDPNELIVRQCEELRQQVRNRPENHIAVVTHSSWLQYFMAGRVDELELDHCKPYRLQI